MRDSSFPHGRYIGMGVGFVWCMQARTVGVYFPDSSHPVNQSTPPLIGLEISPPSVFTDLAEPMNSQHSPRVERQWFECANVKCLIRLPIFVALAASWLGLPP